MLREVQEWRMPDPKPDLTLCVCGHGRDRHNGINGACISCLPVSRPHPLRRGYSTMGPLCRVFHQAKPVSIEGRIKGQHADFLIVDDVLEPTPTATDSKKALEWYANTMAGRNGETVAEARARVGLPPLEPEDDS